MVSNSTFENAREQYFAAEKTQAQIAKELGIHDKTLSYWIKHNKWREARNAARHMPIIVKQHSYSMLINLQEAILTREPDKRYPDRHEAEIQRKLLAGIKQIPELSIPEIVQVMKEFTTDLVRDKCKTTKEVAMLCDNYIKKKINALEMGQSASVIDNQPVEGEEDKFNNRANYGYTRTPDLYNVTDPMPEPPKENNPTISPDLRLMTDKDVPVHPKEDSQIPQNSPDLRLKNVDNSSDENFSEKDKNENEIIENQTVNEVAEEGAGIKMDKSIHKSTTPPQPRPVKGTRLFLQLQNKHGKHTRTITPNGI